MAYTKQERELYELIKREAFGQAETLQQAEAIARDYLYYSRQNKFRERYANLDVDYRGRPPGV